MTENSQIHRFFYKSELIKSDHPYQMYDQRSHPGNHTLPYHNTNSPFAAHFTFDRSDSRHTWCIEQTEYQQGCCCQRSQYRGNISTEKYFQSRYHAFFAINPLIRAVQILQSPNPIGLNIGARTPATIARILSAESFTRFKCRSKLCRNQIIIDASRIIENALCRKSLLFPTKADLHSLLPAAGNWEVP